MESRLEKIFSIGINCMSLAVWLGEDRKCFATVVGSDLASGLSMVRRCSLNRSFKRRLVSPMYCKLERLLEVTLNYVDEVFCVPGQVRFLGSVSPVEKKVCVVSP